MTGGVLKIEIMEKILYVTDAITFSRNSLEFQKKDFYRNGGFWKEHFVEYHCS